MSVFTTVTHDQLNNFLAEYNFGFLLDFTGIEAGVTNSIYAVKTSQGQFVLTLFEELNASELPFYINLINFLVEKKLPCAKARADKNSTIIKTLNNKPAVLMDFLPGEIVESPDNEHCYALGEVLARLHLAAQDYSEQPANPRGRDWQKCTAKKLYPILNEEDRNLLQYEMTHHEKNPLENLPKGIIHADLFRDNVLFADHTLTGVIDFYYAGYGPLLLDIAITANDWCRKADFHLDQQRLAAFLDAYQKIRPLIEAEQANWQTALRFAALRFWLSRLLDFHFAPSGDLVQQKDPDEFKQILLSLQKDIKIA